MPAHSANSDRRSLPRLPAERLQVGLRQRGRLTRTSVSVLDFNRFGIAVLSTTAGINVNQPMLGVPWNHHELLEGPFRHDRKTSDSRLFCTKDDTRVRLYVSLLSGRDQQYQYLDQRCLYGIHRIDL